MSNIVITKLEKRELLAMLFFGLWFVFCVILCLLLSNIVITILGKGCWLLSLSLMLYVVFV